MAIDVYLDYTFVDSSDYEYSLSVEEDFTYIRYFEYNEGRKEQKDKLMLPTPFAYEIAKKIIEEYERMNNNEMARL